MTGMWTTPGGGGGGGPAPGDLGTYATLALALAAGAAAGASSGMRQARVVGASGNIGAMIDHVDAKLRYLELDFAELASDEVSIADVSTSPAAPAFGAGGISLSPTGTDTHSVGVADGLMGLHPGAVVAWCQATMTTAPTSAVDNDGLYIGIYSPTGGNMYSLGRAYDVGLAGGDFAQGRLTGNPDSPIGGLGATAGDAAFGSPARPTFLGFTVGAGNLWAAGGAVIDGANDRAFGGTLGSGGLYSQEDWQIVLTAAGAGATYVVRRLGLLYLGA